MTKTAGSTDATPAYALGHSDRELERLSTQAQLIDPITRAFFKEGGVARGMRVLDVGSGAGDVALLVADMVGPMGEVVGADRSSVALTKARARVREWYLPNVIFREGDPVELKFDRPFDAVVGRFVLMFNSDPAAMLRGLARHLRPGGVMVFHEPHFHGNWSFPAVPAYDRCIKWIHDAMLGSGADMEMGTKLYATFVAAGLPPPSMRAEALIGGVADSADRLRWMADLARTLLPEMERQGVATAAEVGVETLAERMRAELLAGGGVTLSPLQIAAWTRV
jgi:ubiquinone/menaquinone biosynthesis C-methylase UbiE